MPKVTELVNLSAEIVPTEMIEIPHAWCFLVGRISGVGVNGE